MQMNSQNREDIEKTVLALLFSRKRECTLSELTKDYYETEGKAIPWRDLGYLTFLNFLQSMSKYVQIEYRDNVPYVKGIPSDKSKHVSKLVANQKDKKHIVRRKLYKPNQYYPPTAPQRIYIPAEILIKIVRLVNDYPNGISKDYLFNYVQSLMPSVNILMSDMEEQLHELSHKIYQTRTKVFPIQKKSTNFDSESLIVTASGNENMNDLSDYNEDDFKFVPLSFDTNVKTKPTFSFIKENVFKCQDEITENNCVSTVEHVSKKQIDQNNLSNLQNYNWNVKTEIQEEFNNNIETGNSLNSKKVEMLINQRIQFRLEKLIQNNTDGIWCADLPQKYLEEYGFPLNYTELGFNSVREFASHLPEIFHCVQPYDSGDFMLYFAKMEIPSNKSKEKHKVNLAQLHHIYVTDDEEEPLPTSLSLDTCKKIIPNGIVTIGESVGQLDVAHLVNDEKPYIEIIVVEVFTPSFFWIQLRRKQKTFKLFMDELHNFYMAKHQEYAMPPVVLEKGLNCACMYNKIWHRGIIKTVKPDLQVTVMFYDYGTLKTYPPEAIHYLHRRFSTLPAQAIPCGLINTRPYKAFKWTSSATHHFAIRTSQIPLIATIASINTEDNSMMVTLTDTIEEEDVHINDWLVEQKLAQHGKMGDKVDMNNLMLYVEENLLFSPEQCYEAEISVFNTKTNTEKKSINMPLISPQSILGDKPLIFSSEFALSDELQKLTTIKEENLQTQTPENDSSYTIFTSKNPNTNPFLQDDNQIKPDLTPEKFLQLWNENLKLQMQITATFNVLFNKIMKNSNMDIVDNPAKDKNVLNVTDNTFLHTNKDMPTSASFITVNTSNTCPVALSSTTNSYTDTKSTVMNGNFMNNSYPIKNSAPTISDHKQSLHIFSNNEKLNSNNSWNATSQSMANKRISKNKIPPGFENIDPKFNSDNENDFLNDTNIDVSMVTMSEKSINSETLLKETNPFRLSLINKLRILDSQEETYLSSDDRVSVLHKNQLLDTKHDLVSYEKDSSNVKSISHDIPENLCKDISYNDYKYFCTDSSNNANNTNNSLSALDVKSISTDYTWTVDNVTNNMSKVIINNPSVIHNTNEVKGTKKPVEIDNESTLISDNCNYDTFAYTPSYLRINSQEHVIDQKHKENTPVPVSRFPSSNKCFIDQNVQSVDKINERKEFDTNKTYNFNQSSLMCGNIFSASKEVSSCNNLSKDDNISNSTPSSWLPFNNFLPSVSQEQDNTNIDEGYLTSPSTLHTSFTLSSLEQPTIEVDCSQQSLSQNLNELCDTSANMWIKSVEDKPNIQVEHCDKVYSPFKKNKDVEITCSKNQCQNCMENTTMKDTVETQAIMGHTGGENLYAKESKLRNIWKSPISKEFIHVDKNCTYSKHLSPKCKIFFQLIELPKQAIHIFHHQGEGWLLVDEFLTFTEFQTFSCMLNFLYVLDIYVPFNEIDKSQYSIKYIGMYSTLLKATQDIMYNINSLRLISINSVFELLNKVNTISQEDVPNAMNKVFSTDFIHEILLVVFAYGKFKYYIESGEQL
ncbi:uncharacterized protein LOC143155002 isoform X2 [Ptiloglossa arizonensis]|uniref:uncharacterized protein LOC143155002 isoform X2 n=1 Tax=Ptiloglossa arizonensis TaxID=3350558 RepID=UPI003F9F7985